MWTETHVSISEVIPSTWPSPFSTEHHGTTSLQFSIYLQYTLGSLTQHPGAQKVSSYALSPFDSVPQHESCCAGGHQSYILKTAGSTAEENGYSRLTRQSSMLCMVDNWKFRARHLAWIWMVDFTSRVASVSVGKSLILSVLPCPHHQKCTRLLGCYGSKRRSRPSIAHNLSSVDGDHCNHSFLVMSLASKESMASPVGSSSIHREDRTGPGAGVRSAPSCAVGTDWRRLSFK